MVLCQWMYSSIRASTSPRGRSSHFSGWTASTFIRPRKPSAALSGLQPFALMERVSLYRSMSPSHPGPPVMAAAVGVHQGTRALGHDPADRLLRDAGFERGLDPAVPVAALGISEHPRHLLPEPGVLVNAEPGVVVVTAAGRDAGQACHRAGRIRRPQPVDQQGLLPVRQAPKVDAWVFFCVCSIESGPCERVESLQMSGRF